MTSTQARLCTILIALIVALAALLPAAGGLSPSQYVVMPPGDFSLTHSDTGHFDVYYDSLRISDPGVAVVGAEGAYDRVVAFYGPYGYTIRVILASNHQQYSNLLYNYLSGESISDGDVASAYGEDSGATIVIEAPDQLPDFPATLAYELALIDMRTTLIGNKDTVPEWFSQGLAEYVSGDISASEEAALEDSSASGKLMTAQQMEDILAHPEQAAADPGEVSLAHTQAGMLMQYVAAKYNNDTIKLIMQDFATTGDLDKAFMKRTGFSPEDLNAEWEVSFRSQLATASAATSASELSQQVYGYVADSDGKPMDNETIAFTSLGNDNSSGVKTYSTMTNGTGYYKLNLTYGALSVHLDRPGYADVNANISLQKGEVKRYNVTLVEPAVPTDNTPAGPAAAGDQTVYVVLGVLNAIAIVLIVLVLWRTRK